MSSMVKLLCSEVGVATIQMNIWHLSSIIFCLQTLAVRDHKIGGEQKILDTQLTQFITRLGVKETLKVWESCGGVVPGPGHWTPLSAGSRMMDRNITITSVSVPPRHNQGRETPSVVLTGIENT